MAAPERPVPGKGRRPPHRLALRGRLLAMLVPALMVGTLVAAFAGERAAPSVTPDGPPGALARLADVPAPVEPPRYLDRPRPTNFAVATGPAPHPIRRPARPVRLSIRSVGVRARIVPVAAHGRNLAIPPVTRAGWYKGGPRPGEPGHTVIVGHIDSYHGPGVFARLGRVRRGTRIAITDRRGYVRRFSVVGKAVVPKSRFPAGAVFGASRHPVLVLVTCGGRYSGARKGYRDNVIVFARARA